MNKHLHIVAFDVPFPPVYGGIIDLYFQLKALHKIGVKITYHSFYYDGNNPPNDRLNEFAEQVFYYHRKKRFSNLLFNKWPFIVASRNDKKLLQNLQKDDAPILFSGLQSCYFLGHSSLQNRLKFVRTHNIEHSYYRGLARAEKHKIKKRYYLWEAKKLEKFEKELYHANGIFSIAKMDINHFKKYAPCYHSPPYFRFQSRKHDFNTTEKFGLFQGNLGVNENIETVKFISEQIIPHTGHQIIIAGKNPSNEVHKICAATDSLQLIPNPDQNKMNELLENAQVNLLFTKQQTGIKLKLLHALAIGKHVVINSKMDDADLFKPLCKIEDTPEVLVQLFNQLMNEPFTNQMFEKRQKLFLATFNNKNNAEATMRVISD